VAICSHQNQWEKTKRKGGCQCHACGEAQGQNYGYHGSAPFLVVWRLPKQGKQSVTAITFWSFLGKKKATKLLVALVML
jgi:hypothetical protein